MIVNPDGFANQIEGGCIQSTSWTLREAVAFDGTRILTRSWNDYPILRIDEVPAVDVRLIDRRRTSARSCRRGFAGSRPPPPSVTPSRTRRESACAICH
jgi:CO/xanthine dehydrogenase Mo-binding subunit